MLAPNQVVETNAFRLATKGIFKRCLFEDVLPHKGEGAGLWKQHG
ncbi:hypothetical protein N9X12_07950 [Alphaproteobacteria bacterium]|nr:hypothetical protein [Alphaproteobacteria bacterium]